MYELRYMNAAESYFKKLKDKGLKLMFRNALERMSVNPYEGEVKHGDLAGLYCYDVYYNKTNYEIAYRVYEESNKTVAIILAGTRENFYKELKRHMK
ncbi:MAG: type II toxin-antitoxin system RelE/ParE family toxin [Eubacteriales bacterium]|nr:type II toxin-antitoxin system RelE/ParE family toxin [Eubacteriales bacterium]